jgi:benzoyl-CoA reductase/2-hydroxyglutaryl-CoA dehydratase subunit BcrC/BadD/HgdB
MYMRRIGMSNHKNELIAYACAYTPLVLLMAAGYQPYRVLPLTESPEKAGLHLHDNLCPHVKRILDRAMAKDLPELKGMVFMNSCDAMRRLSDAWNVVHGSDNYILIDLPVITDETSVKFFATELRRLAANLEGLSGNAITDELILKSIHEYNMLANTLNKLAAKVHAGVFKGGQAVLQAACNKAATRPISESIKYIEGLLSHLKAEEVAVKSPAIFLFGNILPDKDAFELFEDCGARIVDDDLCTGSRLFQIIDIADGDDHFTGLSRSILNRRSCARTFDNTHPGKAAFDIVQRARTCNADGVICHTAKFCDPYLARLPFIIETLRKEGIPMLMLEGDCTTRSMGQHRTRIEAFIEMLG